MLTQFKVYGDATQHPHACTIDCTATVAWMRSVLTRPSLLILGVRISFGSLVWRSTLRRVKPSRAAWTAASFSTPSLRLCFATCVLPTTGMLTQPVTANPLPPATRFSESSRERSPPPPLYPVSFDNDPSIAATYTAGKSWQACLQGR